MSVIAFTRAPVRAIHARPITSGRGWWFAEYVGDQWREAFDMAAGGKRALMEAITDPAVRCGLPIVTAQPRARRKAGGGA